MTGCRKTMRVVLASFDNRMEEMVMLKNIKRLLKDEEAPTAVEYALMVAGIAVVIIAAVWFLGTAVSSKFDVVGQSINK